MSAFFRTIGCTWRFFIGCARTFASHHLSAYAAQATFYLMLALFPFTMLTCLLSRLLPIQTQSLQDTLSALLPESFRPLITALIEGYYNENIDTAQIWLILFLIWTSARLFLSLMNAFNTIYNIEEIRGQMMLRLIGCLYTVALCILLLALLGMMAFGRLLINAAEMLFPDVGVLHLLFSLIRNLASPLLLMLIFWCSYVILPSRRPTFRQTLPGAFLNAILWRGAVSVYGLFLQRSLARYSYVYGGLTGLVMVLVWLYFGVYCWLIGAELNRWLAHRHSMKKRNQAI